MASNFSPWLSPMLPGPMTLPGSGVDPLYAQQLAVEEQAAAAAMQPPPNVTQVDESRVKVGGQDIMSDNDYKTLMERIRQSDLEGLRQQGLNVDEMKKRLGALQGSEVETDFTPAAALIDAWTGSNFAQTYKPSETKAGRAAAVERLQNQINQAQQGMTESQVQMLKSQLTNQFQLENMQRSQSNADRQYALDKAKLANEQSKTEDKFSEAEKVIDRKFGAMYHEDVNEGGFRNSDKDIANLDNLLTKVEKEKIELSNSKIGMTPAFMRSTFYPKAVEAQQAIEKQIQDSMKATLGAAFTEKEGTNVIKRTFDPSLPTAVNLQRARSVLEGLKRAREAKLKAIEYYENQPAGQRSMRGYKGSSGFEAGFQADLDRMLGSPSAPQFTPEEAAAELARRKKS